MCESNAYLFRGPWGLLAYSEHTPVAPVKLLNYEHCGFTRQSPGVNMYEVLYKKSIYAFKNVVFKKVFYFYFYN